MTGVEPTADDEDVIVDLLDVLLEKGVVLEADVVIGIADIPLVGIKLRAAIAGLTTMREYGMFEAWDLEQRGQRRSHAPIPGGSVTGRPNPRRAREPETEPTAASGRPTESSRPDTSTRPGGSGEDDDSQPHSRRPSRSRRPTAADRETSEEPADRPDEQESERHTGRQ